MGLLLEPEIVDAKRRRAALERLRKIGGVLPTWSQLAEPDSIPGNIGSRLAPGSTMQAAPRAPMFPAISCFRRN